jgi:hypothetical protein
MSLDKVMQLLERVCGTMRHVRTLSVLTLRYLKDLMRKPP